MFQKFFQLFKALNDEALNSGYEDLTSLEEAQEELVDAWTDYIMVGSQRMTRAEYLDYCWACNIVNRFSKL